MFIEILGGALLGSALAKTKETKIEKKTSKNGQTVTERYAVLFEIKKGKGDGTACVNYLTSSLEDAIVWAQNACTALCAAAELDYWSSSDPSSGNNPNFIKVFKCSGEKGEFVFVVMRY